MKRLVSAFALACTSVLAASNSALADSSRLVRVSSGDPFANCIIGGNGSGRSYRSAEVEPWIADNPANAANLVGVWQQDRWSDGGDGSVYSVSLPFDPLIARADTLDPSDDKESVTADPNRPGWAYMEAAPIARGFFVGDYEGLAARIGREASGQSSSIGQDNGEGSTGFVPLFVMTNCKDNSCRAQFSLDGTPVGPDSTETFTNLAPPD